MSYAEYRITIDMKNVAEYDATDLATLVYDAHGEEFDAQHGEFTVSVAKLTDTGVAFDIDWKPES